MPAISASASSPATASTTATNGPARLIPASTTASRRKSSRRWSWAIGTALRELSSITGAAISVSSAARSPNRSGANSSAKPAITRLPVTPTTRHASTAARCCSWVFAAPCTRNEPIPCTATLWPSAAAKIATTVAPNSAGATSRARTMLEANTAISASSRAALVHLTPLRVAARRSGAVSSSGWGSRPPTVQSSAA